MQSSKSNEDLVEIKLINTTIPDFECQSVVRVKRGTEPNAAFLSGIANF